MDCLVSWGLEDSLLRCVVVWMLNCPVRGVLYRVITLISDASSAKISENRVHFSLISIYELNRLRASRIDSSDARMEP